MKKISTKLTAVAVALGKAQVSAGALATEAAVLAGLEGANIDAVLDIVRQSMASTEAGVTAKSAVTYASVMRRIAAAPRSTLQLIANEAKSNGGYYSPNMTVGLYEVPAVATAGKTRGRPAAVKAAPVAPATAVGGPLDAAPVVADSLSDAQRVLRELVARIPKLKGLTAETQSALTDALAFVTRDAKAVASKVAK